MPFLDREVERCAPNLRLKIDVTASSNELLRDGSKPFFCRGVEWRPTILRLKIDVTASSKELFRDFRMRIL